MGAPIRILQVFNSMNRGGAESMIMNLYRQVDKTKVQFDFVVHTSNSVHLMMKLNNWVVIYIIFRVLKAITI